MIHTMENTAQDNVIDFSFQMKDFDDESLSLQEVYLQTRFYAIKAINMAATGKKPLTPEVKKAIRVYNRYCKVAGTPPIEGDFR